MSIELQLQLGSATDAVANRLHTWGQERTLARVWERDHTVWSPTEVPELINRLGWLDLPARIQDNLRQLDGFLQSLLTDNVTDVVVLGMGGSSLAAEVFSSTFTRAAGHPKLHVLDSTHPDAVTMLHSQLDVSTTVFIVSSKSGTTIEPLSFFEYFWEAVASKHKNPGSRFVAITDQGSNLTELATQRGFRKVFIAPTDVGGRYAALTSFGLVAAAAIGNDLADFADAANVAAEQNSPHSLPAASPASRLGAALGELALAGRDKATFITTPDLAALPSWIEQLVAESTGKDDRGIVPIVSEPLSGVHGTDRFFVIVATRNSPPIDVSALHPTDPFAKITIDSSQELGALMFVFELAVALAGSILEVQPFNQPDVQLAKRLANAAMAGDLDLSTAVEWDVADPALPAGLKALLATLEPADYVAIQAFINPSEENRRLLNHLRNDLALRIPQATTLGFGPRFLHSTGQMHKGGPNSGIFIQLVDRPFRDVGIPNTSYSFGDLLGAQAVGDHVALQDRNRRQLLVSLGDNTPGSLEQLRILLNAATSG